ncbi:MAG: hypothetical protein ACKVQS_13055 [Fimbriimonadaceae bacterium]
MHLQVVEHQGPDLDLTREFFLNTEGVLEADVWLSGEKILARITVNDWSILSDTDLRIACKRKLGSDQTPTLIMLERICGEKQQRAA